MARTHQFTSRLAHSKYLDTLPAPDKLRTPLHFSPSELALFKGTNLYGATLDRERDWKLEWEQCQASVVQANEAWGQLYTWLVQVTLPKLFFPNVFMQGKIFDGLHVPILQSISLIPTFFDAKTCAFSRYQTYFDPRR